MKILVTGASGVVGGAIINEIAKKGEKDWKIYGTARGKNQNPELISNFFVADLTKPETFTFLENESSFEVLIHAAGLAHQFKETDRDKFWSVNVEGTRNILEAAVKMKVRHFILISSVSVYGRTRRKKNEKTMPPGQIMEEDDCRPTGRYAESKLKAEELAQKICRKNKISLTVMRLATVIGEEDRGNVSRLIKAIDRGRFLMIGSGENFKSLIYKGDVGRACLSVLNNRILDEKIEIYNVSAGPVPMKFIVGEISKNLDKKIHFSAPLPMILKPIEICAKIIPHPKLLQLKETLEKWQTDEIFSNEKLYQAYHFKPITSVAEAISKEVSWYKQQKC